MRFVRAVWKLLVGIKDALVLLFMLLFFGAALRRPVGTARSRSATACCCSTSTARSSSSRRAPTASELRRRRRRPARISPARPGRGARRGRGRRPGQGGRARPRRLPRRRPGGDGRPRRRARRVRASGKPVIAYATGYTDDGYQLAAHASEVWLNPLGAVAIAGPGGIEPLFQGPARQAGRDRQHLSRRHLQGGGRAVHPQRHVARGARRMPRRWAAPCSKPGARTSRAARPAGAAVDAYHARPAGAVARRRRRHGQGRARRRAGRQASASGARSRRGWPSLAARTTTSRAATAGSS